VPCASLRVAFRLYGLWTYTVRWDTSGDAQRNRNPRPVCSAPKQACQTIQAQGGEADEHCNCDEQSASPVSAAAVQRKGGGLATAIYERLVKARLSQRT